MSKTKFDITLFRIYRVINHINLAFFLPYPKIVPLLYYLMERFTHAVPELARQNLYSYSTQWPENKTVFSIIKGLYSFFYVYENNNKVNSLAITHYLY